MNTVFEMWSCNEVITSPTCHTISDAGQGTTGFLGDLNLQLAPDLAAIKLPRFFSVRCIFKTLQLHSAAWGRYNPSAAVSIQSH